MGHSSMDPAFHELRPWNEGRLIGAKRTLKQQQVWAIRFWLDQHRRLRDRALFDFAIDSKLRGCDVVKVRIGDVVSGGRVRRVKLNAVPRQNEFDYADSEIDVRRWRALQSGGESAGLQPRVIDMIVQTVLVEPLDESAGGESGGQDHHQHFTFKMSGRDLDLLRTCRHVSKNAKTNVPTQFYDGARVAQAWFEPFPRARLDPDLVVAGQRPFHVSVIL